MFISLSVPILSATLMLAVTIYVIAVAVNTINSPSEDGRVVDIQVVLAFGILNLIVDVLCVAALFNKGLHSVFHEQKSTATDESAAESSGDALVVSGHGNKEQRNLNMISAGMHIGCDTLRTVFFLSAAIIASTTGLNGTLCDAYSSLAVSVIILFMVALLVLEIFRTIREYCFHSPDESRNTLQAGVAMSSPLHSASIPGGTSAAPEKLPDDFFV